MSPQSPSGRLWGRPLLDAEIRRTAARVHGLGRPTGSMRLAGGPDHLIAQKPLGRLYAPLQVAHGIEALDLDTEGDHGLRDGAGDAGHDGRDAHELAGADGLRELLF